MFTVLIHGALTDAQYDRDFAVSLAFSHPKKQLSLTRGQAEFSQNIYTGDFRLLMEMQATHNFPGRALIENRSDRVGAVAEIMLKGTRIKTI